MLRKKELRKNEMKRTKMSNIGQVFFSHTYVIPSFSHFSEQEIVIPALVSSESCCND